MASNLTKRLAEQPNSRPVLPKNSTAGKVHDFLMPDTMENAIGQAGAGVLELLAPSPKSEPGSAASFVPGGAREIYNLADLVSSEVLDTGHLPAAEHNMEMQQATRDASSEMFGVGRPDNTTDLAFRVAGGALTPAGGVGRTSTRLGRVSNLAARLAVPLNQGKTARGFTAEAALGTAAPVALQEGLGAAGVVPQSQFDTFLEPSTAQASEGEGQVAQVALAAQEQHRPGMNAPEQQAPQQSLTERLAQNNQQFLRDQSEQDDTLSKWLIGGAAALGGGLVARGYWRKHRSRQQMREERPELLDEADTILTGREETVARGADTLEGVALFNERLRGQTDEQFRDMLSLAGSPVSRRARADNTIDTGFFPSKMFDGSPGRGEIKMPHAPATVTNAIRQHPQANDVRRLIELRDELDTRKFAGRTQKENIRTRFVDMDTNEISDEIARIETNVQQAKSLANAYRDITRSSLDYMRARGLINEQDYTKLLHAHPNYAPRMQPVQEQRLWEQIFGSQQSEDIARSEFEQTTLQNRRFEDANVEPVYQAPDDALENYIRRMTSDVDTNEIKMRLLRDNEFEEARQSGIDTVSVRVPSGNATRTAHYRVNDPFVRHLLKFQAPMAQTVGNAMRRVFQQTTTGRFNPFFAPTSLTYDVLAMLSGVSRNRPRRIGALPADWAKNVPDITAVPLSLTEGVWRGLWGSLKRGSAEMIQEHVNGNRWLKQALDSVGGEGNAQRLADRIANAYANSMLHQARRGGALHGRFNVDPTSQANLESALARYTGVTPASRRALNAYRSFLDSIQNGARLQYFTRNYKPNMSQTELNRLMRDTRNVTADFSRAGAGGVEMKGRPFAARLAASTAGGFSRAVPYGNVMIQAMRRYGQMAKENPQLFAASIFSSVVLPQLTTWYRAESLTEQGQYDYVDYYWNQLSWNDRLMNMYWFHEGEPPQNATKVPMLPEHAVFTGMLMGLWDSVAGWSTGQYREGDNSDFNKFMEQLLDADSAGDLASETLQGATEGASRVANPGLPPLANFGAALTGQRVRVDLGEGLQGRAPISTREIYSEHIPEGRYVTDALHNQRFEETLSAFFGISADTAIQFGQAAERAYYGTGDLNEAMQEGGYTALRGASRFTPGANMLFGAETRRSVYGDRAEDINRKEKAAKKATEQLRVATGSENVARLDYPALLQRQTAGGIDPQQLAMASEVANFYDSERDLRRLLDEKWDQLNGIDQSTAIPAANKPTMRNRVIEEMTELRQSYHEDMLDFEEYMSKRYNTQFRLEDFQLR